MENISVIITSPSIDTKNNIGGISNVTSSLIIENKQINYIHFVVGKKDNQKRNIIWFLNQFNIIFSFVSLLLRKKEVQICHFNLALASFSILINIVIIIIAKFFKKKVIVHLHGGALNFKEDLPFIQKYIIRKIINLSDKVIVLGAKEYAFITGFYKVDCINKVIILPNAVNVPDSLSDIRKNKKTVSERLNIIYIGRIDYNKGLNEILDALLVVKDKIDFHFYFAGSGDDYKSFIEKCETKLINRYTYLGVLDNDEKPICFQQMHVFLMPSYFEGLPLSLLETMAYGIVPVVTPVGSIPEVVTNNENGLIVPVKEFMPIVDVLIKLYDNIEMLNQMGNLAYQTIRSSFSLKNYLLNLNKIYFSTLND